MGWALFDGVPEGEVEQVLAIARRRRFERGEVVCRPDDPADSLHLIVAGRFAVSAPAPLGESVMLTVLGPGASFGELALADGGPRSAKVEALEDAETLCVHKLDFQRLQRTRPAVSTVL